MKRFAMAAAAATLALFGLVMSAHATTLNDAPGGMLFNGQQVTRTDHKFATSITALGSFAPPYIDIHIVDGNNPTPYNAVDCVVDQLSEIVTAYSYEIGGPANDTTSGIFTLHPDYCYWTSQGKGSTFTPTGTQFTFDWHVSDVTGDWNIQAATMSMMLPGICTYNGFSGTGTVTKQP